jgi:hypothetical protein
MIATMPFPSIHRALQSLIIATGLFASVQSSAEEYRSKDVGGWVVTASKDQQGCFVTRTYAGAGETTLLLGLDVDGGNRLSVLNGNWSIREKERQSLNFRLSKVSFPKHLAIGITSDGKQGFVTNFGQQFPADFASSEFLHISRGDIPVERLALAGSGAAVAELRKCVDLHRMKPAVQARESNRSGNIPLDPFAPELRRKPRK